MAAAAESELLVLYLFDEVMPKSIEGEMAAKRADAIAAEEGADFVNTGTSRVRKSRDLLRDRHLPWRAVRSVHA